MHNVLMSKNIQVPDNCLIGVISDTHGQLPQSVLKVFAQTDLIIHAGDIGDPQILKSLGKIAPTLAVRGNMDSGRWARRLPPNETVKIGRRHLHVLHDVYHLDINLDANNYYGVVHGHTHRPQVEKQQGVLFVNPGSAVHPKYGYPPSVVLLQIEADSIGARLMDLTQVVSTV